MEQSSTQSAKSATFRVLPKLPATQAQPTQAPAAFAVATSLATLEQLRSQASNHHQQYVVLGRNAMLSLMAQVYGQFHAAKESGEFEQFMNGIRNKMKLALVELRKSTPDCSALIRYVFADFDDKQVHVYGRSLDVAYANRVAPSTFEGFVEGTKGGFDGVRETAVAVPTKASKGTQATALTYAKAEATIATIEVHDWKDDDEDFRVMIAVRNEDGITADIKDAKLSAERNTSAILMYLASRKELSNPPKRKVTAANQAAALNAKLQVANVKVELENFKNQLNEAQAARDQTACDELRPKIVWAQAQVAAFTAASKSLILSMKESVTA